MDRHVHHQVAPVGKYKDFFEMSWNISKCCKRDYQIEIAVIEVKTMGKQLKYVGLVKYCTEIDLNHTFI